MVISALDVQVTRVLIALGFSPKNIGFHYIRRALVLTVQDPSLLELITKNLYPELAKQFDTKSMDIELSMRFAIGDWFKDKIPGTLIHASEIGDFLVPEKCPSNTTLLRLLTTHIQFAHTLLS